MENIKLNILDCSFQRKLKPIQNLSLLTFTISWVFIFILLLFNGRWASILFYTLIVLSLISIIISIITSLFFFKKKKIGILEIDKEKIVINNKIYDVNDWYFDLNIYSIEEELSVQESIKRLPFWGNFIINKKQKTLIEFEPNSNLQKVITYFDVENSKRSALTMKTTDLFKNIMSILWAAS